MTKIHLRLLAVMAGVLMFVTGCAVPVAPQAGSGEDSMAAPVERSVISVYIGSDTNISDWWSNSVKPAFEDAHPEYELEIVHTGAGGGGNGPIAERALAALTTGDDPGVDYFETQSVLQPIGAMEAGLYEEITVEKVPNLANVIEPAIAGSSGYDIPYRGSQVLLAYNAGRLLDILKEQGKVAADVTELPTEFVPSTWPELMAWTCEFPGEFIYPRPDTTGAGREFVTRAVFQANGLETEKFSTQAFTEQFGTEELTAEQIAEINETYFMGAWDMLNEIESCLYDNASGASATTRLLADELVTMITIWSDQALQARSLGLLPEDVRFIQLEDLPMVGGYASSTIPSNASNLEGALALANFLLSPVAQEQVVREIGGFPAISWDDLPADLREDFNDVITSNVPTFGGPWTAAMFDGWYSFVAPDVTRE
ncbi:extracellular solute-binding protein [bacterium]|nr:extracellular solute-binding protein [bacterium]